MSKPFKHLCIDNGALGDPAGMNWVHAEVPDECLYRHHRQTFDTSEPTLIDDEGYLRCNGHWVRADILPCTCTQEEYDGED